MPLNVTNSSDYYDDSSRHGEYQFISLEDIVNNYLMARTQDDYTTLTPRYKVLFQARRGMRELYYDVVRDVRAVALEIGPALNITLPPDYINYARISWVDDNGLLHPMAVDTSFSVAKEYLQDNEYEILFDESGCPLEPNRQNISLVTPSNQNIDNSNSSSSGSCGGHYEVCNKFAPNKDASRSFPNGKFNIDAPRGIIQFDSTVGGKNVVLEYISDGLYTGCEGRAEDQIRIHKFAETAMYDWIYWNLIKNNRHVPAIEKQRARKEYYNSRRVAKRRVNTIRYDELLQVFKGTDKWIK